jgi:hypothetical protein
MTADQILTAIGLIGIGGLIKSLIDFLIASRKTKEDSKHGFKETRYKTIILLCYALVNYEREKTMLVINRPDINSIDRLRNELHAEFINSSLFASDNVILKMKSFITLQNGQALNDLILTMRKDLYGIKTSLSADNFVVEFK